MKKVDYIAKELKDSNITDPRFWDKVELINDEQSCWNWTVALDRDGYGAFAICKGKTVRAPRFAWTLTKSEIPNKLCVVHRCDNRRCVRPSHLLLGTRADNSRDMVAKQRNRAGENHPRHKLTLEQVGVIRSMLNMHAASIRELADMFNVTYVTIWQIAKGLSWKRPNVAKLPPKKPVQPVMPDTLEAEATA